ncbi:receptor like protein 30-like [Prunus avium]|uniref:Receptor like protein 30-like n=1 Tax=Prunus avium TaxID=42229 RepID=A0A6P5RLW2_PRUAV|nr:receptor like protein 30-like [Prunus avium]
MNKLDDSNIAYTLIKLCKLDGLKIASPPCPFDGLESDYFIQLGNQDFFHVKTGTNYEFYKTQALGQVDECSALLQFKESFAISKSVSADPLAYPKVSFWTREGDGNRSNCCSWDGVECDEDFGHVVGLDLRSSCLYEISKLSKLSTLDLSFNDQKLDDSIPLKLTKANMRSLVQNLTTIKQLHLNWVEMYSTVPDILVNASSLTSLQLGDCELNGEFPIGIFHLPNLEVLDVEGFDQNPINLPWQNLRSLDLQTNMLQGSLPIPPQSIRNYMVGSNHYSGEISPSFCNLNHLQILDLSNNNLSGMLPQCLGNSSALEISMLTNNSFHGSIPQMCPDENSLKMVDSSYNQLQGKIPRSMANCTQLEFINLENNQISDIFPSWSGALPALRALVLRSNRFHGMIGKSAANHDFPKLCIIDLSNNGFLGMLPSNYLENWNSMKFVGKNQQHYFSVFEKFDSSDKYAYFYAYPYSITTFAKEVELKYTNTPYLLRLIYRFLK